MWYQLQRHHHEGQAAGTVAQHADEENETAMEGTRAVPAPLPSLPSARELEAHRVAYTLCSACEDESAMLITSGWQLKKIT